jgi:hypothetical protein
MHHAKPVCAVTSEEPHPNTILLREKVARERGGHAGGEARRFFWSAVRRAAFSALPTEAASGTTGSALPGPPC